MLSALWDCHALQLVEVTDVESGTVYRADREAFERHAFRRDLGAGENLILPLEHWETIGGSMSKPDIGQEPGELEQMAFDLGRAGRRSW